MGNETFYGDGLITVHEIFWTVKSIRYDLVTFVESQ